MGERPNDAHYRTLHDGADDDPDDDEADHRALHHGASYHRGVGSNSVAGRGGGQTILLDNRDE